MLMVMVWISVFGVVMQLSSSVNNWTGNRVHGLEPTIGFVWFLLWVIALILHYCG